MTLSGLMKQRQLDWSGLWNRYVVAGLDRCSLGPDDIRQPLAMLDGQGIAKEEVGTSYEGRPIYQYRFGHGPIKVLAWSQMHGDEPTATAALLDMMAFFLSGDFSDWQSHWQQAISVYVVPMLNPDGAHRHTRINAQGIDINRDAARLQSPEGRLLNRLITGIKPDFAFNLHDQDAYYALADSGKPSVLAFLAPPGDVAESITHTRKHAMQLISYLSEPLAELCDGCIGRYQDSFSPRAFGDFSASQHCATILIESGYQAGDFNRQRARQLNFVALLMSLDYLASRSLDGPGVEAYETLPLNKEKGFCDLLLRNLAIQPDQHQSFNVDVAVNVTVSPEAVISRVQEIGDSYGLSGFYQLDARGLHVCLPDAATWQQALQIALPVWRRITGHAHFTLSRDKAPAAWPFPDGSACWGMAREGKLKYALVQGLLIDLDTGNALNSYTLGIRK